jgi:RNA polymerase sigma-70 factor (ECF subfamily)
MMREVEGLSTAETADLLGISEEAVKVRLHRGREALRIDIDNEVDIAARNAFLYHAPRCNRMVRRVYAILGILVTGDAPTSCTR